MNVINKVELPVDILINDDLINEVNGSCLDKGNFNEIRYRNICAALNKEVSKMNIILPRSSMKSINFTKSKTR